MFITTQTTQSINPHVYKSLPYDPVKSFEPVSALSLGAQVVMVRNDLPATTIAEFIELARKQPGKLSFGSGNGSSRGAAELFRIMAKVDLLGVPYKTQPQVIGDLLGGRLDIVCSDLTTGLPAVLDGRARGLAVTSKTRMPGLEQFPPVDETVPGFEIRPWSAAYVPAGTPRPIVDRLNALVRDVWDAVSPAYRPRYQQLLTAELEGRHMEPRGKAARKKRGPRDVTGVLFEDLSPNQHEK